jgi:TonB-dependent receptor
MIEGKSVGMATDDEGKYRLANLDAGQIRIIFRYLGYESVIREVTIDENVPVTMDITLKSTTIQGEEVVVTGQRRGQLAAINQQITSNKITNVVSKDRIRELPDNNAAESISRLPGVSIQRDAGEGTKIIVRGLEPKYNSITINGQKIPATDAQNRSVDLSMISSDILAGMEVVKALTPDMDADAVGGTVNFEVKKAEAGLQSDVRFLGGYNDLNNDYQNIRGSQAIGSAQTGDRTISARATAWWERFSAERPTFV